MPFVKAGYVLADTDVNHGDTENTETILGNTKAA
jgi:hypothetical protein